MCVKFIVNIFMMVDVFCNNSDISHEKKALTKDWWHLFLLLKSMNNIVRK